MKNNLLCGLIILLLFVSLPYFILPYETDENNEVIEGFRGGKRGGGKRGGRKRGGVRRRWRRPRFYRRSGYRRYPYGSYYRFPYYSMYDILSSPYTWGNPYGYTTYNWFDYRNCPSGCVANSNSPSGYSCVGSNTGVSCITDYDCAGCNNPFITTYY